MPEKETEDLLPVGAEDEEIPVREFALDYSKTDSPSSAEVLKTDFFTEKIQTESEKKYLEKTPDADAKSADTDVSDETKANAAVEEDPIFRELSEPKLPELPRENRARLLMQSPTRLNFYWALKNNPFQTLKRLFGAGAGNYVFIVKLVNLIDQSEEIFPVETEGTTWFTVDADAAYRAEIGFYAPARPFIRVLFSNRIETPRRSPSPRRDYSPFFDVSANRFAEVLDVSGFRQDAFEVALAGDDAEFAETATQNAFSQFTANEKSDFADNDAGEMRFALLAVASGVNVETLREQISKNLFAKLMQTREDLTAEKALAALRENFGVFADETTEEEFFTTRVFGASVINFPRGSKKRFVPKFAPVSSQKLKVKN